jgi:hypothetical protein
VHAAPAFAVAARPGAGSHTASDAGSDTGSATGSDAGTPVAIVQRPGAEHTHLAARSGGCGPTIATLR